MNRVLQIVCMWLLLIALPVQGYAAATMLACGTGPQHETMAAEMPDQHDHTLATQVASSPRHDHCSNGKQGSTSCNSCQVCHLGAIASPCLAWMPLATGRTLPSAAPAALFSGHIPSGLERPPRLFLA